MWYLWDAAEGVIKMTHTNERHNYQYVQREPRVAVLITDPEMGYRYLQVRGVVEKIEPDPEGRFYQQLQMRYRGTTSEVKDAAVRVIFTIRPTAFVARSMPGR